MQTNLALTEGEDVETHFSGPPRQWGGPKLSANTMDCRVGENACPLRIQPSLALKESGDDETSFLGLPRR